MEPTVVSVSQPFIGRSELSQLSRPHFDTVRNAAAAVWRLCDAMCLPVATYSTAMVYLHKTLVLNPDLLRKLEAPGADPEDLRVVAGGCVVTAFLTEGHAKKVDDVARLLDVTSRAVLAMQRIVLETNCFDFRAQCAASWVVKLAKSLEDLRNHGNDDPPEGSLASSTNNGDGNTSRNESNDTKSNSSVNSTVNKTNSSISTNNNNNGNPHPHSRPVVSRISKVAAKLAWLIAIDAYETTAVIQFPAHAVAAACIEIAVRHTDNAQFSWDAQRFGLRIYALRTSTRLLLEFYSRCARHRLTTHAPAPALASPEFTDWLASLQRAARSPDPSEPPPVRDGDVSAQGTARYRVFT